MLNGACRQILSLVPVDVRQQFDEQLCQILSSKGAAQNSMLLLWCFGIVLLVEHPNDIGNRPIPQRDFEQPVSSKVMQRQWKTSSGQKLFGSTKGTCKTITLTCMSVVWAAKGHVGVSDEEAIEGTRIASRVLRFVDQDVRENWPKSSPLAANTFSKLSEKIKRAGINRAVLFEALYFYAMIVGQGKIEPEMVTLYEQCLAEFPQVSDPDYLGETLALTLPVFAVSVRS